MVLQRNMKVPVWGTARPGETVTVKLAGKTAAARADAAGRWEARIGPLDAGGPHEMTVTGSKVVTFRDVLIGEVWFGSGQSNMQIPMCWKLNGNGLYNAEKEIAAADHPQFRLRTMGWGGGWQACTPKSVKNFSALGYYFGRELHRRLDVPVGIIACGRGRTAIQVYMSPEALEKAGTAAGRNKTKGQEWARKVAPAIPYGVAGVIWYQGEANVGAPEKYLGLFTILIEDWREKWGRDDLPFLFAQLGNTARQIGVPPAPAPGERCRFDPRSTAATRESQRRALKLPHTGMMVSSDLPVDDGVAGHPLDKPTQGKRLALLALERVYGKKVVGSGPLIESIEIVGNKVLLKFKGVGEGLAARDREGKEVAEVHGFALAPAGNPRNLLWARGKITGKKTVEVWSEAIGQPGAVLYGADENASWCNLYNSEGLPASIFVSDDYWKAFTTRKPSAAGR